MPAQHAAAAPASGRPGADPLPPRRFELLGAPFDGAATLGWPGSRYAPERIRAALGWMLQRREDGRIYCLDHGTTHPFPDDLLTDGGDVHTVAHDLAATLDAAADGVRGAVRAGRIPVLLGGDDSLLYPAARGLAEAADGTVAVIHLDAHLDLLDRNEQQGTHSHSSGMRRAAELPNLDIASSIQLASRHFNFPSSLRFREERGLRNIPATAIHERGVDDVVDEVIAHVSGADRVLLAFDIDAVDPAHAPGAGAHEPGGLTSFQAVRLVQRLAPHVHAMVLTEVNPLTDLRDQTANLAAYLVAHLVVHGAAAAGAAAGEDD
ncbi:arginase family protein [Marinitenerispora sediminis]|uniref:Arginase n=1 Tax=Marinitenerispora sediminis TaxID=1931232 RepID=A0A368T0K3_9ACTN|nr:arginase family protein [Marinitenerispora sediminis]RCV52776.1 arginase [Marinitenerispora sediminis]RCV52949.1 arginase [Marinitenerispora sediminis]RCV53737.1 arginase [Marinitenerispora sediminis]